MGGTLDMHDAHAAAIIIPRFQEVKFFLKCRLVTFFLLRL